jgi:hypothetical protein
MAWPKRKHKTISSSFRYSHCFLIEEASLPQPYWTNWCRDNLTVCTLRKPQPLNILRLIASIWFLNWPLWFLQHAARAGAFIHVCDCGAPGPGSGRCSLYSRRRRPGKLTAAYAVNWSRLYNVFLCDSINAKETIKSMTREGRNAFIIKALKRILTCWIHVIQAEEILRLNW